MDNLVITEDSTCPICSKPSFVQLAKLRFPGGTNQIAIKQCECMNCSFKFVTSKMLKDNCMAVLSNPDLNH